MSSNDKSRSIGHRPYGLLRLVVNSARARGYKLPHDIHATLKKACSGRKFAHLSKPIVELVDLQSRTVRRTVLYAVKQLVDTLHESGQKIAEEELRDDLLRFLSHRNQISRLMTLISKQEGRYQHAVIAYAKNGDMPDELIDMVMATCAKISRQEDIGYMLDVGERTHFHVVCGASTLAALKDELVGFGYGIRIRITPPEAEAKWAESGTPRDLISYLPMKLTPRLQERNIARTIKGKTGTLDPKQRSFGRIVTHLARSREPTDD